MANDICPHIPQMPVSIIHENLLMLGYDGVNLGKHQAYGKEEARMFSCLSANILILSDQQR